MTDQPTHSSSEGSWTEAPKQYQEPTTPSVEPAPDTSGGDLKDAAQELKEGVESAAAKVSSWWKSKGEQEVQDFFKQAGEKIDEAATIVEKEIEETVDDIKTQPPEQRKSVFGKFAGDVQNLFGSKDKPQKPQ